MVANTSKARAKSKDQSQHTAKNRNSNNNNDDAAAATAGVFGTLWRDPPPHTHTTQHHTTHHHNTTPLNTTTPDHHNTTTQPHNHTDDQRQTKRWCTAHSGQNPTVPAYDAMTAHDTTATQRQDQKKHEATTDTTTEETNDQTTRMDGMEERSGGLLDGCAITPYSKLWSGHSHHERSDTLSEVSVAVLQCGVCARRRPASRWGVADHTKRSKSVDMVDDPCFRTFPCRLHHHSVYVCLRVVF